MSKAWPDVAEPGNRDAILAAAAALAGSDGLHGPSAGTLAMVLGRSMAGATGPRSRQELQVAVVTEAGRIFDEEVVQPALAMGTRTGPVRDLITALQAQFGELIRGFAAAAVARNEFPAGEDPGRLAFELNGIMLATDTNFVQHEDPAVLDLARQIVRQRLGVGQP